MNIVSYNSKKNILELNINNKIVRFSLYCEIVKEKNYSLCVFRKCYFNIFKNTGSGTSYEFECLFTRLNFDLFAMGKTAFPFENNDKETYITIIKDDEGYNFLNINESIDFFESVRVMNKLSKT